MSQGELKVKRARDRNHRMAVKRWNIKTRKEKFCLSVYRHTRVDFVNKMCLIFSSPLFKYIQNTHSTSKGGKTCV